MSVREIAKLRSIASAPTSRYADVPHLKLSPPSFDTCVTRQREADKMPSNIVLAYLATDYVAFSDGRTFSIRVGQHSLVVDGLLTRMKARSGAFITVWNPFSKSQSAGANAYWDRELKACLSARGFAFLAGEGRGEVGEWPPNPVFSRSACPARRPLPSVGVSDKMQSCMSRWVDQPN
jgi:Protein of unknown function (DUF3293)